MENDAGSTEIFAVLHGLVKFLFSANQIFQKLPSVSKEDPGKV